jgi:uncharacterized protein (TIGR03790 family)
VLGFDLPSTEEISRSDFNRLLADPLREKLVGSGLWKMEANGNGRQAVAKSSIRFLAIVRGVPLKIAPEKGIPAARHPKGVPSAIASRNDASVDSELAALGLTDFTPAGMIPNPYYGRFTPILEESIAAGLLLPSRLDAPSSAMVKRMIDDSLAAERDGLWGWAYIDGRDITTGAYTEGDNWMRHLVEMLRHRGVPTIFENLPTTFPEDFPITDAAVYYGWYDHSISGPFAKEDFSFKQGAVAVHLHSYSASTLRSIHHNWCGPLIARGAAATLGNVYEPYLAFTANLDLFQDRLMSCLTLAEAGWMSQRAISWMGVVVGDPLYRPYAAWNRFFDPRNQPTNHWRRFRSITLAAKSSILDAVIPLYDAAQSTGDSMFLEALGAAQVDSGQPAAAVQSFRAALALANQLPVRERIGLEIAGALRRVPPENVTDELIAGPSPVPEHAQEMPDASMVGLEPDSPLRKIAPTPPPLPNGIPNLPYPDL